MVSTSRDNCKTGSIVIISYDMMTRCHDQLTAADFRVVIAVSTCVLFLDSVSLNTFCGTLDHDVCF